MTWIPETMPRWAAPQPQDGGRLWLVAFLMGLLGLTGCIGPKPRAVMIQPAGAIETARTGAAPQLPLQVVTFNTFGLPAWMTGLGDERFLGMADTLRTLQPEVVLLQEVWTDPAREALLRTNDWTVVATPQHPSYAYRDGLALLTRLPVLAAEFRPFKAEAIPDVLVNKGALKATLRLPDGRCLNVWNVHLQCGPKPRTRARQIRELVAWVETARDGQCADVIAGDFNCTPDSTEYQMLLAHLGDSVHQISGREYFVTFERRSDALDARTLDYVFVRSSRVVPRVVCEPQPVLAGLPPQSPLSDHVGVNVALDFPPTLFAGEGDGTPLLAFRRLAGAGGEAVELIESVED